jgi:hypothetical protein
MAIEPLYDNETEHLLLAGGVLTALVGLVGYAAMHNARHNREMRVVMRDITHVEAGIEAMDATLEKLIPGFAAELDRQLTGGGTSAGSRHSPYLLGPAVAGPGSAYPLLNP